jgi:catechol 2,3-dioxygenase-like lactoylglutathione lyase family enzyme
MAIYLFAGMPVSNYAAARAWYQQLLGAEPAFFPTDTEAVWELGDHRYLYIEERSDRVGQAVVTLLVDDLDRYVAQIAGRGIEPVKQETYPNGVRKVIYNDPEGNEIGFGPSPD